MSNETQNPYQQFQYGPQMPTQAPKKRALFKRFGLPVGLLLFGLLVGGSIGTSSVPDPVEIVKEVPVEKIVEKKVTEFRAPSSCLKAIEHAEEIFGVAARTTTVMSEAISAASARSTSRLNASTAKMDGLNAELEGFGVSYRASRDECKASR